MNEQKHMMLDIETLGNKPDCAILAIGAIVFDPLGSLALDYFDRTPVKSIGYAITRESNALAGLRSDASTLRWWDKQDNPLANLAERELYQALGMLTTFIEEEKPTTLWAHGKDFDFPILQAAYTALGDRVPWKYWQLKCSRDLINTVLDTTLDGLIGRINDHNPINDAYYQAIGVQLAMQELAYLKGLKHHGNQHEPES